MKIISKLTKCVLVCALAFGLHSCSDDDDNSGNPVPLPESIVEIAAANPDFSSLVAALQRAGLVTTLEGAGPFTVLAPTNAAFDAFLMDNNFMSLEEVPVPLLTEVLLNHVIAGDVSSSDLANLGSGYTTTQATGAGGQNMSLYFDTTNGVRFNNVASVATGGADVDASNGTIHIIDGVIGLPTIVTHATANPNLSSLVGALTDGGNTTFTDLLVMDGPFTVFAPVNSAFDNFTNPNGNDLANILSNHVIVGAAALSGGLTNSYESTAATNADGDNLSLYINTDDGVTLNGVANVAIADIVAVNGVVHAVDAVIDIPTVVTFALANPNFSTLVTALTTLTPGTDFASILSRTGDMNMDGIDPDFTVFAPVNAAFDALDAIPDEPVLTQVLLHHVIDAANIRSGDLTDGIMPTMLNNQMITINLPGTGDNIADVTDASGANDIGIVAVDVQAGNGVIHVLNKVMIPSLD